MTQPDTADATERPREAFSQLRGALIRALRAAPEAREPLCDALEIVEGLQRHLDDGPAPEPQRTAGRKNRLRSQAYAIQKTAEGQFLAEHRAGDQQPFRCPRQVYDAAAELLAAVREPVHFDELADQLNQRLAERQPDYRLRVALRFWMSQEAVLRSRSRYRPAERGSFIETARKLWEEL